MCRDVRFRVHTNASRAAQVAAVLGLARVDLDIISPKGMTMIIGTKRAFFFSFHSDIGRYMSTSHPSSALNVLKPRSLIRSHL
jgi:hypothetical protein